MKRVKYYIIPAILIIGLVGCSKGAPDNETVMEMAPSETNDVNNQQAIPQVSEITKVGTFPDIDEAQPKTRVIGFEYVSDIQWKIARDFSEGLAAVGKDGDGCGFIDINGNFKIGPNPKWTNAGSFSEGLARIRTDGKWGYINKKGEIVIPCEWDRAYEFSDGLACVVDDKKISFIDTSGKIAIPLDLSIDSPRGQSLYESTESTIQPPVFDFSDGLAQINSNYFDASVSGFVNTSGEILLSEYQSLYMGLSFSEGLLPVRSPERGTYGFIDSAGVFKIKPNWERVEPFNEGVAWVMNQEERGFIDKNGDMVFRFPNNTRGGRFSEGKAWVCEEPTNYIGFINSDGELVKTEEITPLGLFVEGLCPIGKMVTDAENSGMGHIETLGYIDETGELVITSEWDSVELFNEGVAIVTLYDADGVAVKGYIRMVTE